MERTRCPTCKRFGSSKLDGYCKSCYPGETKDDNVDTKHILEDFHEKAEIMGEFFSNKFGIIKDTFGVEDR